MTEDNFIPANLVDYAPGSVVSKAIIKKPAGNITLFAFDEHEELSEHTAPHDAFVQVLEGTVLITVTGIPYTLKTGECIILPGGEPHSLKALGRFKVMLVMIR